MWYRKRCRHMCEVRYMKVLLVNKFHYKKGGSETYYFTVSEALEARGHQVIFFAMKDDKNIHCDQEEFFVSNSSIQGDIKSKMNMALHIVYSKEAYDKMKKLLEHENPDLVILNLIHKQITLSVIDAIKAYNSKIPIFWIMHDLIAVCPAYTMLDGKGNICKKCLAGNFWHCVANKCIKGSRLLSLLSRYEADYIRKRKWYDQINLFICPSEFYRNILLEAKFTSSKIVMLRNPLPLESQYEVNDMDNEYILYFGRLAKEKGIKLLIDAVKIVGCRLVILGTGPLESDLHAYANNDKNIEFKGFQMGEVLIDYIKKCRCAVLPSEWYENGPYSAMEAMAFGKPLIVSNNGGLPELVEDGKNGFIYRGVDELISCIKRMMELSQNEYKIMANRSLEKAKELFDPNKYIDEIEMYYNSFIKGSH